MRKVEEKVKTAFRQVSLSTTFEAEEAVSFMLEQVFGQQPSVFVHPEREGPVLSVYLTEKRLVNDADRNAVFQGLKAIRDCGLDTGSGCLEVKRLRREDWVDSWRRHFKPIHIETKLLVKPGWCKDRAEDGQKTVILDPGLSFGTGQHATTKFCLRQLVLMRDEKTRQSLLDIGTGSGILAVAGAKLGYQAVKAIDYDSEAVRVARYNAMRNQVDKHVQVKLSDVSRLPLNPRIKYDVVCANLFYDLLVANAPRITNRVKPGGVIILAGILDHQFDGVQNAFEEEGMCLVRSRKQGEWRSGCFKHTDR